MLNCIALTYIISALHYRTSLVQSQMESIKPNIGECEHRARLGRKPTRTLFCFKILFASPTFILYVFLLKLSRTRLTLILLSC